ncbi:IclR family transcriptional regulator [Megasphaera elsdenii]|uniref:IclR family transcriptional regulator n=1 Tax=Megasphaera elsdenii TaxID=907 RepID=UPI001D023422|nr:IclR family transcriptional regulator [Megasphaera elsdenii]MCB5702120.1 IclR family transcriptional regulator [Megasphaera elsdenii]MCB5726983.1 IclR family transcriptional regulator [Megasphaera elsdenii]MCB5770762.1 IclR family transcriptional regulator [Megasphaera elsdenii]
MVKEEHHSSLLKSLEKSLDVLDLFVECNTGMTLKEIAEHTHLNTSTAFRIVNTLERRQYLTRNDTSKQYRLGPRALALGYSSHWTENVITLAKPYLRRLQQLFNETVSIYIAEGDCRICLDHIESTHSLRRVIPIGESLPLYKGAAGRVLLAWTSDDERQRYIEKYGNISEEEFATIRHNGYAITQDESEHGLFALSVPIFNFEGQVIASLTIAGPSMRFYDSIRQKMLFTMSQYAYEISHSLGYRKKE